MLRAGRFSHGMLAALIFAMLVHAFLIWGLRVEPSRGGHPARKSLSITLMKPAPAPVVVPPSPVSEASPIPVESGPPVPSVAIQSEIEAKSRGRQPVPKPGEGHPRTSDVAEVGPPAPPLGTRFVGPSMPVFVGPAKPPVIGPVGPPFPPGPLREPKQPGQKVRNPGEREAIPAGHLTRQPKPVITSRSVAPDSGQAGHDLSPETLRRQESGERSVPASRPPSVSASAGLVLNPHSRAGAVREDDSEDEEDGEDVMVPVPPVKDAKQRSADKPGRLPSYVVPEPPRPPVVSGLYPPGGKPILPSRGLGPGQPSGDALPSTMAGNLSGQTSVERPESVKLDRVPEKKPSPPAVKDAVDTLRPKVKESRGETPKAPKEPTVTPKRNATRQAHETRKKSPDGRDKVARTRAVDKSPDSKTVHESNRSGHGAKGVPAAGVGPKSDFSAGLLSQQIAEVGENMFRERNSQLRDTRIVYATEMTSNRVVVAAYEQAWQEKVERIGNLNFPDEARRDRLTGKLVLAVGIKADGGVYSIRVLKSSGHAVLDNAARSIVNLAAPFAPLPDEISSNVDVLVIQRTWLFDSDYHLETMSK